VLNLVTGIIEQRRLQTELEQYAKVAAHDLSEPLSTIALCVEQLSRRHDRDRDPGNERLLELLRRTHARAKSPVDGILEHGRSSGTGAMCKPHRQRPKVPLFYTAAGQDHR